MKNAHVHIVGGGLAGCEAAHQLLTRNISVTLHEMRPQQTTAAHKTGDLAELVCSNSFKSLKDDSAPGLLKYELTRLDCLILEAAKAARVPAGQALAVERKGFSSIVKQRLQSHPLFTLAEEEQKTLPPPDQLEMDNNYWLVASGPLTSDPLAQQINQLCGANRRLFFYDAIAPILAAESIDMTIAFVRDRYGENGSGDYLNLPLSKEDYNHFIDAVKNAEKSPLHGFEETAYFEACLPIEVMIERGPETLRFGPLKPVGLTNPHKSEKPYAVVQLRKENNEGSMYSMVGFQTKMKWPEQRRVFSMIPGLADCEFLRYGSVHRNTYVDSPKVLNKDLSFKTSPRIFLAGQLTGVEGYTESTSMGLVAALAIAARIDGKIFSPPPPSTMIGALLHYVTHGPLGTFQPMNTNLGLMPTILKERGVSKQQRRSRQCAAARRSFDEYFGGQNLAQIETSPALSRTPI